VFGAALLLEFAGAITNRRRDLAAPAQRLAQGRRGLLVAAEVEAPETPARVTRRIRRLQLRGEALAPGPLVQPVDAPIAVGKVRRAERGEVPGVDGTPRVVGPRGGAREPAFVAHPRGEGAGDALVAADRGMHVIDVLVVAGNPPALAAASSAAASTSGVPVAAAAPVRRRSSVVVTRSGQMSSSRAFS
jgi:hypothetical protein